MWEEEDPVKVMCASMTRPNGGDQNGVAASNGVTAPSMETRIIEW